MVTGNKNFACQDGFVSQIFNLIISSGGKMLSNIKVVVTRQVKGKTVYFRLPFAAQKPETRLTLLLCQI